MFLTRGATDAKKKRFRFDSKVGGHNEIKELCCYVNLANNKFV